MISSISHGPLTGTRFTGQKQPVVAQPVRTEKQNVSFNGGFWERFIDVVWPWGAQKKQQVQNGVKNEATKAVKELPAVLGEIMATPMKTVNPPVIPFQGLKGSKLNVIA
jgi:hypothetical protein